jgi:hypothetical protein
MEQELQIINKEVTANQIKSALEDIKEAYKDVQTAYYKFCKVIQNYQRQAIWSEIRPQLIEQEILGDETIRKLESIAQHPHLMNTKNWNVLPNGYNHLVTLTAIKDKSSWEKALEKINPSMSIKEAKGLVEKYGTKSDPKKKINSKNKPIDRITYILQFECSNKRDIKSKIKIAEEEFIKKIKRIDSTAKFS